jgi:hypothetical protein
MFHGVLIICRAAPRVAAASDETATGMMCPQETINIVKLFGLFTQVSVVLDTHH